MRKQSKLVAVLSAAALLAIGASMTSFAATGWTEEEGTWVYYDKDEYKVTDTWKKSGNFWYYLDEDGYMATSKLIENGDDSGNTYYVDETGRMATNKWVELENDEYYDSGDDNESETNWYYFQNSGKAYRTSGETSFKTINSKKYAFDESGRMLYGWVGPQSERVNSGDSSYIGGVYYCGDSNDGARVTSDWRKLYVGDEGPSDSEDDEYWFYFQPNGKKFFAEKPEDKGFAQKKINGKYYGFDDNGMMVSEWYESSVANATELYGHYNDGDNGARQKGWFKAVPSEKVNTSAYNDDSEKWFYGNNDGKLVVSQIKTINGKKYAFNKNGEMMNGVHALVLNGDNKILGSVAIDKESIVSDNANYKQTVRDKFDTMVANGEMEAAALGIGDNKYKSIKVYYFGGGEDGAMKTGNQTIEIDGDTYQFAFGKTGAKKGQGFDEEEDNFIYVYGKKVKADSDYRYQGVDEKTGELLVGDDAEDKYLINTSGTIMKGSKYTDSEGRIYTLNSSNKVTGFTWKE